jgi:hypothetical protein
MADSINLPPFAHSHGSVPDLSIVSNKRILWSGPSMSMDGDSKYNGIFSTFPDEGNTLESSLTYPNPFGNSFKTQFIEMLIRADEISDSIGGNPRKLSELGFFCVSPPDQALPSYQIDIQTSSLTSLEGENVSLTPGSTVFSGRGIKPKSNDWFFFPLGGSGFVWDGTSNIYISVCWSAIFGSQTDSGSSLVLNSVPLGDIQKTNVYRSNDVDRACDFRASPLKEWGFSRPCIALKWFVDDLV